MQKIIKVDSKVIVMFEDGSYCERDNVSEELFKQIVDTKDDEEVYALMCPEYTKKLRDYRNLMDFKESISKLRQIYSNVNNRSSCILFICSNHL